MGRGVREGDERKEIRRKGESERKEKG